MPILSNHIFWSGTYKRPVIGAEKGELTRDDAAENRVSGSDKSKTSPIRILVSDSRDLAYEYSKNALDYDLKNGKHMSFTVGLLRVWQKEGREWKEAAAFLRPYEN
jgi:ketosteroid isomerase-like protein